jgi:ferrochelatase
MTLAAAEANADVGRLGILLVNLGTPDAPTPKAVRRYLSQFLSDRRVVSLPPWLWQPILQGVILRTRPAKVAHNYASIWLPEGSPLLVYTQRQTQGLAALLEQTYAVPPVVTFAMCYGQPTLAAELQRLRDQQVRRLLVLPLYPQFSSTTTAAVFDAIAAIYKRWYWFPETRFVNDYHAEPGYIEALAASVQTHWQAQGRGERLLISFHGLPQRVINAGDPYFDQCLATAFALATRLQLAEGQWEVVFQSRFGREPWLQPYADRRITELAQAGVKRLDVICPGFASDCLETLEEINLTFKQMYLAAGGEVFHYIPALNAQAAHLTFLAQLVKHHVEGWSEARPVAA